MFTEEKLKAIFQKTDGRCRYCGKQLAYSNHGARGRRGAWEVDHSRSRANGGSDHGNNLFAACIACNEDKGSVNGASYRQRRKREGRHVPKRSWWSGQFR